MDLITILIPVFPLLGFLVLGAGFRTIPRRWASLIGPGTVLLSFLTSVAAILWFRTHENPLYLLLYDWMPAGSVRIPFEFLLDPLSSLMLLVVTGVGFVIHVYAVGYMKEDPGFNRFFAYMNLFVFSMLLLVLGAGYPMMFIGWEGVGLCSYLLIGFWFRNRQYGNAARKAFIMNRIGDLGFLLGMFLIFQKFGSLGYRDVFAAAPGMKAGEPVIVAITLLLFVGAVGKSAQIPLFTWLPDAMAGPTPVSALIHAATMVTAGVYMVARSHVLYLLAPDTLSVIGVVGVATALLAASTAIFQNDIKKVLAYSTISQLGYMFAALGAGAFTGAMFHLTTHAFFKALLFLGAGSVIHAMGGEQDIRRMGGLSRKMPRTWMTFLAGTLAIAGIPPLSGFFSKDEILLHLFGYSVPLWTLALAGSLMTAFYMFRLLFLVFRGSFRGTEEQAHHVHESPAVMTLPLVVLAGLAVAGGALNLPALFGGNSWMTGFLDPVFRNAAALRGETHAISHATEWALMAAAFAGSLLMLAFAWRMFGRKEAAMEPAEEKLPFWAILPAGKFFVDELYDRVVVRPITRLSEILHDMVEVRLLDRLVNGTGSLAVLAGNTLRYIQTGNTGFYLFVMILGIIAILAFNLLA